MKKHDLWFGVGMAAAGLAFLLAALLWETPLDSLFCGFFGALAVPGVLQIYKYFKWTSPKNAPVYREKLEQEQIDLRDERKSMLRDRSGRVAYLLGLAVVLAAMPVFFILEALGVIGESAGRLAVLLLAGYALFQYLAGIVIYRFLEKKY